MNGLPSRESYERGGWKDGRLGQAYDLIASVLEDAGEQPRLNPLLGQIEAFDEERIAQPEPRP